MKHRRLLSLALAAVCVVALLVGYRAYLVHELRKPLLAQLSDPDAALFRDEMVVGPWLLSRTVLCGQVNARNRSGGYNGYHFFDSDLTRAILENDALKEVYDKAGIKRCDFGDDIPWWWLRW